jgi:hypothetical protein
VDRNRGSHSGRPRPELWPQQKPSFGRSCCRHGPDTCGYNGPSPGPNPPRESLEPALATGFDWSDRYGDWRCARRQPARRGAREYAGHPARRVRSDDDAEMKQLQLLASCGVCQDTSNDEDARRKRTWRCIGGRPRVEFGKPPLCLSIATV